MTNVIVTVSWCINIVGSQSNLPWFSVSRCRCPARLPANKSIMAAHLTHPLRRLLVTRRGKPYPRHELGHQLEQILTLETARGRKERVDNILIYLLRWWDYPVRIHQLFIDKGDQMILENWYININICFECRPFRLNIQRRGRGGLQQCLALPWQPTCPSPLPPVNSSSVENLSIILATCVQHGFHLSATTESSLLWMIHYNNNMWNRPQDGVG